MGYLGKRPATQGKDAGPSLKLDDVSSNFDGLTTVFDLTVNGTAVDPHINNIQIYLSGVHQLPGTSYSLSGSQVVFTGAPSSSLNFHGSIIGDARLFIPDNDTVEPASFTSNTTSAISGAFGDQRVGTTDDVQFNHITASGNISSSGIVIADTFQSTGGSVDGISFTDDLNITGNITASGAISSSVGNFTTVNIDGGTVDGITSLTAGGDLDIGAHDLRAATLTADGLTATRVPFAGTDGVLSDDSDLTFATDTLTATKIGAFTAAGAIDFDNQNMTNVDIDSGTITGITDLTVADGGTGASTAAAAAENLGLGITDDVVFSDVSGSTGTLTGGLDVVGSITGSTVSASTALFTTATIDKIGGAIDFNNENMTNVDIDSGTITGITDLTVADGGTGVSTLTDGGVLLGSGAGAITAMSVLADSEMIVGDGSTDPVAESGATLRTSIGVGTTDDVKFANITGSNNISASGNLSISGNVDVDGTSNFAGDVTLQNDLVVTGRIDAEEIHTTFISSSITQATGSNLFGDSTTDSHQFTGSVDVSGSLRVSDGNVVVSDTLTATNIGAFTAAGAIDFNNENMTNVDIDSGTITGITDITVADGGTGVSTLTDGGVLLGSGTSAITAMAVLTDGQMIVGDGTTDPVAESGATLRTSIGVGTTDDVKFANITGSNNISASGNISTTGTLRADGNVDFNADLDVDGTTNLDVVDIDGAVDMASTLALGGTLTVNSSTVNDDFAIFKNTNTTSGASVPIFLSSMSGGSQTNVSIENAGAGSLVFRTGNTAVSGFGTEALTIDSSQNSTFAGNVLFNGVVQLADVAQSIDFIQSGAINFDSNGDQTGRVLTIGSNRTGDSGGTTNVTFAEDGTTLFSGTTTFNQTAYVSAANTSTSATFGLGITNTSSTSDTIAGIIFKNYDNNAAWIRSIRTGSSEGVLLFGTNSGGGIAESNITERMRITADGKVGIKEDSPDAFLHVKNAGGATPALKLEDNSSGVSSTYVLMDIDFSNDADIQNGKFIIFQDSGGVIGSISGDDDATSFNTSSDYRKKTDLKGIVDATGTINQLKLYDFAWKKNTDKRAVGVIAHEAQEVFPNAVSGEKDAMTTKIYKDENGDEKEKEVMDTQTVDYSKFVPLLLKSIQELTKRIEELEN